MKAESLYIQKLTYDENTGNEIIGLFPSEANPAIVSSYTYDAKRMGGAPTITATIYSSEPLQWKKEEFVEYNGDRLFASYTPNPTKDNSSRMWKSEITFTSRRELLDNTLFFDVVVDDVDTQNKDRYRSNQTKFTFGGTIHEFVARINSSMAYCGLYRPTDEYKGYYVVVDEGYGTDEVKEVSFEDQYLTDVLQLVNTTFELDYYWDGSVCHVGKVQHDLTDTPIKYGCSDALISVSKENANYKIVDMITGYGSSDNLPYYYPNDDEFGEAVFNTENIIKDKVSVELSKFLKDSRYNDTLVLYKSKEGKSYNGSVDVSPPAFYIHSSTIPENLSQADSQSNPTVTCSFWINIPISAIKGQKIDLTNLNFSFELFSYITRPDFISNVGKASRSIKLRKIGEETYVTISEGMSFGNVSTYTFEENGDFTLTIGADFSYNCKVFNSDGIRSFYGASVWNVAFGGSVEFSYESKSEYEWKNGEKYIPYSEAGINVSGIGEANCIEYDYQFVKDGDRYGFNKVYTGTEDNAVKVIVTDRVWIAPSSVLMPSIYRNTKGAERFYYALNNTHKLPSGSGYYEFVNLYKKGNPHQGTVTFDDIKPTINGIVNAEGQLFGEIADVAFDKEDSDVKDSDGTTYIHQYFYIKLHKFNGEFGFDLFNHVLAKESAKINLIKSNGCPACSFVIYNQPSADNSKCYNCVSVDENGNLKRVRTDKNDYIFANASDAYEDKLNQDSTQKELWIAVQKDTSTLGIVMPNASAGFKPQKGDLFVITGIKPPKVLVTAAEKRLDDALIKHMSENNTDQFNYSVKFSRIFLQENPDFASKLNENAKLSIQIQGDSDSDGNLISHEVFVSNYSVKVDNDELAEVEIELVNSLEVTKSDVKQIIDAVKGEAVKSLSSMVGGSSTNNFNASITDKMYLSKLKDDIAKGLITFERGIKLGAEALWKITLDGVAYLKELIIDGNVEVKGNTKLGKNGTNTEFGVYATDSTGARIQVKEDGTSTAEFDYITIRRAADFRSINIHELRYIGGELAITPAAMQVSKVERLGKDGNVVADDVEPDKFKCYFDTNDSKGEKKVYNEFIVGDQARCQQFGIEAGTHEFVKTKYYWRLVVEVGEDYIVLSNTDKDKLTTSEPSVNDNIVQLGYRYAGQDNRQSAIILSATANDAPSQKFYQGINDYSLDHVVKDEGYDAATGVFHCNIYGDSFIGGKDGYFTYDSKQKKATFKGTVNFESDSTLPDGSSVNDIAKKDDLQDLNIKSGNLLRNTSFCGDYESIDISEDVEISEDKETFSEKQKYWTMENARVIDTEDSTSGKAVQIGSELSQQLTQPLLPGKAYVLSFKGKGTTVKVSVGGEVHDVAMTSSFERYELHITCSDAKADIFSMVSTNCTVCEIMLSYGTIAPAWSPSYSDNDKSMAEFQNMKFLTDAISQGSTTIDGGLVMSQQFKVGNYRDKKMIKETGGMSGYYNDDDSPFLWGGGTLEQAIYTIQKYKDNPNYEPTSEELNNLAKFVVTHGGRAILTDIILRGIIYAEGGVMKSIKSPNGNFEIDNEGNAKLKKAVVESLSSVGGYFKDVSISGNIYTPYTIIDDNNKMKYGGFGLDWVELYYKLDLSLSGFNIQIGLPETKKPVFIQLPEDEKYLGAEVNIFCTHRYIGLKNVSYVNSYDFNSAISFETKYPIIYQGQIVKLKCIKIANAIRWIVERLSDTIYPLSTAPNLIAMYQVRYDAEFGIYRNYGIIGTNYDISGGFSDIEHVSTGVHDLSYKEEFDMIEPFAFDGMVGYSIDTKNKKVRIFTYDRAGRTNDVPFGYKVYSGMSRIDSYIKTEN